MMKRGNNERYLPLLLLIIPEHMINNLKLWLHIDYEAHNRLDSFLMQKDADLPLIHKLLPVVRVVKLSLEFVCFQCPITHILEEEGDGLLRV
jgi:hypothetical protein